MSCVARIMLMLTMAGSLVWTAGCRQEPAPAPPAPEATPPAESPAEEKAAGQPAGDTPEAGDQSQSAEIQAAFASLSSEDRALAEKQKICPVSEEPLGAMGPPMKVEVAGREVFICCEHCKDPLLADPAKHLAKIGLEPVEAPSPQ